MNRSRLLRIFVVLTLLSFYMAASFQPARAAGGDFTAGENSPAPADGISKVPSIEVPAPVNRAVYTVENPSVLLAPPNAPALVSPADGATDVPTTATLQVHVTDPENDSLKVSFYGRQMIATTGVNFSIIAIPDTQNFTINPGGDFYFNAMTQYIVDHQAARNIVFVTHMGDITDSGDNDTDNSEWIVADTAMTTLERNLSTPADDVPYSVMPGNHDFLGGALTRYEAFFGVSRFTGKPYYGGHYGSNNASNYSLFSASGMRFIIINLGCTGANPTAAVLNWAGGLLKDNVSRRGIVACHNLLDASGTLSAAGQAVYDALKDNPNLFLMLAGHAAVGRRADAGSDGHTINTLMADYSGYMTDSRMRIMEFQPANNQVQVYTFSPTMNNGAGGYVTGDANQFSFAYNMQSPDFNLINTVTVASGSNASVTWPGLANNTQYEWYAVARDASRNAVGTTQSFTTTSLNHHPVAVNDSYTTNQDVALTVDASAGVLNNDTDLDQDPLSAIKLSNPSHGSLTFDSAGSFLYTPQPGYTGSDSFTYKANDGHADSNTATVAITVNVVSGTLEVAAIADQQVNELALLTFTVTATDVNSPPESISFNLSGAPAGAAIDAATGVFTWTPTEAQGPGSYIFSVCASSAQSQGCAPVTVTVDEVNRPPVLSAVGSKQINELAQLSFTASATDADLPASALTYDLNGEPGGAAIGASTGIFTWTPTEAQGPGSYHISVCVSDGQAQDCETITVTVNEVNQPPVLTAIGSKQASELVLLTFTARATDADLPANTLTYRLSGAPTGAVIKANTGVFTWTPTEAQGPDSYTFDVCVSDGQAEDCGTVTVTVNVPPVLASIGSQQVNELAPLTFTAAATDVDSPPASLSFSLSGAPGGAAINATSGVFSWTPTEAQGPGSYTFSVCASDTLAQDCETITVTVNEINQPPVLAAIGSKQINEQVKLSFTARATDADLPANTLTYTLTNAPAGAVLGASTGAFTWTPTEAQGPGSYTFDVCASDGLAPDCETITVTVNEANQPPVLAHIGNLQVGEQENLTFTASATDADLPAHTLTFSMSGAPSGAAIVATTGVFTWTPTEPQGPGSYPISVCVSDGQAQDCETITVTVDEDNQPPVLAHIGDQRVRGGATLIFTASATDVDLPANTLTFSLVGAPKGARIDPDTGVFTWTPGAAQVPGSYTFDVCVSDGQVQVRETITVRVDKVIFLPFIRHYP